MSGKRKDKKGRVLKKGESQRKDGSYDYRYTDAHSVRRSVYANSLEELRRKEEAIERDRMDGIDYYAGEITVAEQVDRYMSIKRTIKHNSMRSYSTVINRIHKDPFGKRKINTVKLSDAKAWFVQLHDSGLKRNTLVGYQSVLRPAFEMAVEDDIIRKNPFKFKLSDLLPDDAELRTALSETQQRKYLQFIRDYGQDNYYDDIVILLETGMRVSELYGLTKRDIDLERHCVHVRHQLCRTADRPYFITEPKTKSGIRDIPMSDMAYESFLRVLRERPRPKVEMIVDGLSGFVFLDKDGRPKTAMHLQNYMRNMQKKFVAMYGNVIPTVTPHVLRHTFCTNMQRKIDVKSLQYLMGHSHASVTLDVYTHTDYDDVERAFRQAAAMG